MVGCTSAAAHGCRAGPPCRRTGSKYRCLWQAPLLMAEPPAQCSCSLHWCLACFARSSSTPPTHVLPLAALSPALSLCRPRPLRPRCANCGAGVLGAAAARSRLPAASRAGSHPGNYQHALLGTCDGWVRGPARRVWHLFRPGAVRNAMLGKRGEHAVLGPPHVPTPAVLQLSDHFCSSLEAEPPSLFLSFPTPPPAVLQLNNHFAPHRGSSLSLAIFILNTGTLWLGVFAAHACLPMRWARVAVPAMALLPVRRWEGDTWEANAC